MCLAVFALNVAEDCLENVSYVFHVSVSRPLNCYVRICFRVAICRDLLSSNAL